MGIWIKSKPYSDYSYCYSEDEADAAGFRGFGYGILTGIFICMLFAAIFGS